MFVGGHSASFVANEVIEHGEAAIDRVLRGEGELGVQKSIEAIGDRQIEKVPGITTALGNGPAPLMVDDLDRYFPARDLARRRSRPPQVSKFKCGNHMKMPRLRISARPEPRYSPVNFGARFSTNAAIPSRASLVHAVAQIVSVSRPICSSRPATALSISSRFTPR